MVRGSRERAIPDPFMFTTRLQATASAAVTASAAGWAGVTAAGGGTNRAGDSSR
jgi:hypothetical protein